MHHQLTRVTRRHSSASHRFASLKAFPRASTECSLTAISCTLSSVPRTCKSAKWLMHRAAQNAVTRSFASTSRAMCWKAGPNSSSAFSEVLYACTTCTTRACIALIRTGEFSGRSACRIGRSSASNHSEKFRRRFRVVTNKR